MSKHQNHANKKPVFQEDLATRQLQVAGDELCAAGIGLRTIGRVLSEQDLSSVDLSGLCQAITALGALVHSHGDKVYSFAAQRLPGGEE